MDVVDAAQARIAEEAGACAVMALERQDICISACGARLNSRAEYPRRFERRVA